MLLGLSSAFLIPYTRKVHVKGWLMPDAGLLEVYSPQNGTVIQTGAVEGSHVQQGDSLFVISSDKSSADFGSTGRLTNDRLAAMLNSLRQENATLLRMESDAALEKQRTVAQYQTTLATAQRELNLARDRLDVAGKDLQRFKLLIAEKLISEAEYERKQNQYLQIEEETVAATRTVAGVKDEYNKSMAEYAAATGERKLRRLSIDKDIQSLKTQQYDHAVLTSLEIKAPAAGIISSRFTSVGKAVTTTAPLCVLLPEESPLRFHGFISGPTSALVKVGQTIALQLGDRLTSRYWPMFHGSHPRH